jgi:hypothetical protein
MKPQWGRFAGAGVGLVGLVVILLLWAVLGHGPAPEVAGPSVVAAQESVPSKPKEPPQPDFETEIRPLLATYCYDCHTQETQEGGLVIDGAKSLADIQAHREQWTKVFERTRVGAMPPSDAPQPTEAERQKLVAWLDHALFYIDCDGPPHPGRVTLRRLNRTEYRNTVRDLLGVDLDVSSSLTQDDVGHGFDNIGDVLSVPPLLIERYLEAAEQVVTRSIIVPDDRAFDATFKPAELESRGQVQDEDDGSKTLLTRGGFSVNVEFKKAGTYLIEWSLSGRRVEDELVKTGVRVDEEDPVRFDLLDRDGPQPIVHRTQVAEGRFPVSIQFNNGPRDKVDEDKPRRKMTVHGLRVRGPMENLAEDAASQERIVIVRPGPGREPIAAAEATLRPLLRRAFRRPVTDREVSQFTRFIPLAMERNDRYERGIQAAVQAMLVSPQFLFRIEEGQGAARDGSRMLSDHELATRLSYFLWSSMPDDELFAVADAGTLHRDEILEEQVLRMLADPKSDALIENFAAQWLALRKLFTEEVAPDPMLFPDFSSKLRQDMATETRMFFGAILREDRPITDLLDGQFTFLNDRLAKLYGIPDVEGEDFRRVELKDGRRRGLLTHASILTLTSYPNRTSPVKRGEWILANLLGDKPPDPPPVVPGLEETQKANPKLPLRKQLEIHRADPGCASCHKVMDELGFGLENYDAIGQWRDREGEFEIDSAGVLPSGEIFRGAVELTAILRGREQEFARCFSEKLLTFALGRGLEYFDKCAIDGIVDGMRRKDQRISACILGIVRSAPFQMRGTTAH